MLKRILQSCAAAALMASSAFAGNAAGTYTAQTNDGQLTLELRPLQDDLLRGTVHYANQDFPLIAKQTGDMLNGTWECQGRHISFTSSLHGQTLTLTTNGATYDLEKSADATSPTSAPSAAPEDGRMAIAPHNSTLQTTEGRAFRYVVPQGWQAHESAVGVDMAAADGVTGISHAFLISPGQSKPDEVLQLLLTQAETMRWTDVKVESATPRNQDGSSALGMTYQLSYRANGIPVHGEFVIIVYNEAKRNIARVVCLQTPPEAFEREEAKLMDLAHKIVLTHPELLDPEIQKPREIPAPPEVKPHGDAPEVTPALRAYGERQRRLDDENAKFDAMVRGADAK